MSAAAGIAAVAPAGEVGTFHVVFDPHNSAKLEGLGFSSTHAGDPVLVELARDARRIIIVGPRDRQLADLLAEAAPNAELLEAPLPAHVRTLDALLADPGDPLDDEASRRAAAANFTAFINARARIVRHGTSSASQVNGAAGTAFPIEVLPTAVSAFVCAAARAHAVDAAFVAVPALAALAGAVAGTRRIRLKASWCEPAHLWAGIVGPSGCGKSPAMAAALAPLRQRDADLARRTKLDMESHKAALSAWRASGGEGAEPAAPPQRQALLDDATLEAVLHRLVDNPRGLLLAADELCSFARSFDKYRSGGGDLPRWLSIHGGGAVRVDRKGAGGSHFIPRACVGVLGTLQPSVARDLFGAKEHAFSGFSARFLLAAPPTSPAIWTDADIPADVAAAYRRTCDGLLDLELVDDGPRDLDLTPDARESFAAWNDSLAREADRMNSEGDELAAAVASKMRGQTARLALVLELADAAERGVAALVRSVGLRAMEAAIAVAGYFKDEAEQLYAAWGTSATSLERRVGDLLGADWTPRRELHRQLGNNHSGADLDAALHALEGRGIAERTTRKGIGRPAELWRKKVRA